MIKTTDKKTTKGNPRYKPVGDGIYLDTITGAYCHRPVIDGKRRMRTLGKVATKTAALRLKNDLDSDQTLATRGLEVDPYAKPPPTIEQLHKEYVSEGCPDSQGHKRTDKKLAIERDRLEFLLPFWKEYRADKIRPVDCSNYAKWRRTTIKKGFDGGRTIDMELGTLGGLLGWAFFAGRIEAHPLVLRPKFRKGVDGKLKVKHCRDFMPKNEADAHKLFRVLFTDRRSESLGWQAILEFMTGFRTSEVLDLRWDAKEIAPGIGEAGLIKDGMLHLHRCKGGVNPTFEIHPALSQVLDALKRWREWREFTLNPWFIPSYRNPGLRVEKQSLSHALKRISAEVLGYKVTSHGLRAYYVTARRSQKFSDAQIAAEIGDKTGPSIIETTYGAIPEAFKRSDAKPMGWMVDEPAWSFMGMPQNLVSLKSAVA